MFTKLFYRDRFSERNKIKWSDLLLNIISKARQKNKRVHSVNHSIPITFCLQLLFNLGFAGLNSYYSFLFKIWNSNTKSRFNNAPEWQYVLVIANNILADLNLSFETIMPKRSLSIVITNYSLISRFCSSNRVQGMRSTRMDCESAPMDVSRFQT